MDYFGQKRDNRHTGDSVQKQTKLKRIGKTFKNEKKTLIEPIFDRKLELLEIIFKSTCKSIAKQYPNESKTLSNQAERLLEEIEQIKKLKGY